MYIDHLVQCYPCPIWLVLLLNVIYISIFFFETVISEPTLYKLLTLHVPVFVSFFLSLGHLSKESVQVGALLLHFVTNFFIQWEVVSPMPNPKTGVPPLVGCLQLHIQYICSYTQYLEAVFSICNMRMCHAFVTRDTLKIIFVLNLA
jgi:hypothetical protein